jgi:hypothetical protein
MGGLFNWFGLVWFAAAAAAGPSGGARSFLQAVSTVTEEAPSPLRVVQMEGLVIIFLLPSRFVPW